MGSCGCRFRSITEHHAISGPVASQARQWKDTYLEVFKTTISSNSSSRYGAYVFIGL
jgi:hypothetical protein